MAEVFDRYGRAVYSVAFTNSQDTGHAEDVMQEIFSRFGGILIRLCRGEVRWAPGWWWCKESVDRSAAAQKARGPVDDVIWLPRAAWLQKSSTTR